MNNIAINKFILIILILLFAVTGIIAQEDVNDVNSQLQEMYNKKIAYKKDVYQKTLRFINENPHSPGLSTLYFNLAEMSTEIDIHNPSITAGFYKKVLEKDINFLQKDAVLYNIGYYGFTSEVYQRDEARQRNIDLVMNWPDSLRLTEERLLYVIDAYRQVWEDFPESKYNTEAGYRLGTVYFEIALDTRVPQEYYEKAIYYFDLVSKKEGDAFANYGLFQRAWTYFTSANFTKAIEDFTLILQTIQVDSLKIEKTFFEADAIENLAFSLIEYDGTDFEQFSLAAEKAKEIFRSFVSKEYGKEVILKSIDLKHKYNAPMQAVDLYNAYIALYPEELNCPLLVDSIMTIYKRNPSRTRGGVPAEELVVDEYIRLTNDFKVDSLWYQTNVDVDKTPQLAIIREAYEFMEPKYYNNFAQSAEEEDYLIYKDLVGNYCRYDAFKDDVGSKKMEDMRKNVVDFSQDMAESSQNPRLYFAVIADINTFIESYPEHPALQEYKETEFYNYEQIYNILKPTIKETAYVDTVNNITLNKEDLDSLFVMAARKYEDYLTAAAASSKTIETELIRIVYQRAELNYARNEFDEAYNDFNRLLNYAVNNEIKKVSYARLAEISQSRNDYTGAENYYREATKYASDEEKQVYNNNILATMQSKANTLADSADYLTAAQEYLRLAAEIENDDLGKSTGFIVKAIESYQQAGENQTAIDLFLDIASKKKDKNDILAAYISAWTISDSLHDWKQSERLRKQFINKFKDSNEAYKLRLQIICFYEGEQFNDKERAADMYLQLHDEADQMDIAEDRKENIFLNAYRIYNELGNENMIVELCLRFEKLYPSHPKANDFLIRIAKIYNDRGEKQKFEELAAYLYKKDPTIDLFITIAAEKLKEIKTEVDSLFESEQYSKMFARIKDFKLADEHYREKNLNLPTEAIYEAFDYYNNYISFHNSFEEELNNIEVSFLTSTPDELLRVNELTEWKKHLTEGKRRIPKILEQCDALKADIIALIQEGNNYGLKSEDRTRALYVAGKIYDHAADVVQKQIQKYINVSNQLNNEQMTANPVQQKQYKMAINNKGNEFVLTFLKNGVQLYNTLLSTFYDGKDYSDQWTDLAYGRLVELGVRKPKVFDHIYTNYAWEVNRTAINDLSTNSVNSASWNSVQIASQSTVFDSAMVILIPPRQDIYLKREFTAEIKPELITFGYAYDKPVEVYLNNVLIEKAATLREDFVKVNNVLTPHYSVTSSRNMKSGLNNIIIKIAVDSIAVDATLFSSFITLQYDKEKLEIAKTTEKRILLSDYSWLTRKDGFVLEDTTSNIVEETAVTDTLPADSLTYVQVQTDTVTTNQEEAGWEPVGDANFRFFKAQMFGLETSQAVSIWYPVIDSNNVETVFFKKDIDIDGDVIQAQAKLIGQNTVTLWVNGELVITDKGLIVDDRLKKVQSHEISIVQLKPGRNTILAKVVGGREFKGFIFEMNYTIRKGDNALGGR
jgi:hypothetical protein